MMDLEFWIKSVKDMMDLEPMPNRLNGICRGHCTLLEMVCPRRNIWPKFVDFRHYACSMKFRAPFELPHMQVIMTISREQLGYQLTPHSQPGSLLSEEPGLLITRWWRSDIFGEFLVFVVPAHIVSRYLKT